MWSGVLICFIQIKCTSFDFTFLDTNYCDFCTLKLYTKYIKEACLTFVFSVILFSNYSNYFLHFFASEGRPVYEFFFEYSKEPLRPLHVSVILSCFFFSPSFFKFVFKVFASCKFFTELFKKLSLSFFRWLFQPDACVCLWDCLIFFFRWANLVILS